MAGWPVGTTVLVICMLGASLLCMVATPAWAQPPPSPSPDDGGQSPPSAEGNDTPPSSPPGGNNPSQSPDDNNPPPSPDDYSPPSSPNSSNSPPPSSPDDYNPPPNTYYPPPNTYYYPPPNTYYYPPSSPQYYYTPYSPSGYSPAPSPPPVVRNVTCKDTDGKRAGCSGTCPVSCPQQCVVLCPACRTFCPDQVESAQQPVRPPAMFVFGDGQVDVGNSNQLPHNSHFTGPDENDIFDPQHVGTDGYNTAQFLGKFMGFQGSPPAYLTLRGPIHVDEGFTGVNYACAGAGLLEATPGGWLTIPMSQQLGYFAATRAQMQAQLGAHAASDLLAKSFFLLQVGDMDLSKDQYQRYMPNDVPGLLALYEGTIRSLYSMGARRLALVNLGLIGDAPNQRWAGAIANQDAAEFNAALKPLMAGLANRLPGLRYSIGDMSALMTTVFANPAAYGFVDVVNSCSPYASGPMAYYSPPCDNPAQHWYWEDLGYVTQHAANLVATTFFYGPPQFTTPFTFRALLDKK